MVKLTYTLRRDAKDTPVILPYFHEDIKKDFKNWKDLLPAEKRGISNALGGGNIPKSGVTPLWHEQGLLLLFPLGEKKNFGTREAREHGEHVRAIAKKFECTTLTILPGVLGKKEWLAFQEGVVLGTYEFLDWKGKKAQEERKKSKQLTVVSFWGKHDAVGLKRLEVMARAVQLTKDIVNAPPAQATPSYLTKTAQQIARDVKKVTLKVIGEKELKKLGCGGILAVGNASPEESRLLLLEYKGGGKEKPIALVGKGVTYDTGGLSLKPAQYMATMKQDLGGAATVLGAFYAIAASGVKKNVLAVVPTVENSIGAQAYKPDDILHMYNGVTVEVTNTDAEGRLILADALAYAEKYYSPRAMIDLATLTGACAYAVGNDFTAALTTDSKLLKKLLDAAKIADEPMWELPLHQRYKKALESKVADIVNSSKLKAGTIEGGLFLQHFVTEKTPWCHLDIASVAFDDEQHLATGRNVRTLWQFAIAF